MEQQLETQLKRLTTELENSKRVREHFVSLASHDLRTPIAVMKLYMDSLLRISAKGNLNTEELAKRLARASEQCARLDELLTFLVDTARASTGRVTLKKERFDMLALASSAQTPTVTVHGASVFGMWDKSKVSLILTNLVANAVKHGAGSPVEVIVADHGDSVTLTVKDQGPGVPLSARPTLFENITHIVHKDDGGGYEVTVPVLWQIAKAMGGALTLEDTPRGAAFQLRLPKA